jgi:signal transduction histidine kinase
VRNRLFRPFERLDDREQEVREGTGLGLHLSQELARLLKGHIECRSELGVGSTFTVVLPVHEAAAAVHGAAAPAEPAHSIDTMAK